MKVILLKDLAKTGRKSEVVDVPNGYALNQLIPKGVAEPATPTNLKRLKSQEALVVKGKDAAHENFAQIMAALANQVVEVSVEANEQGHLFAALSEEAIADKLKEINPTITRDMIKIAKPIKTLGEHEVGLVDGDDQMMVKIVVVKG